MQIVSAMALLAGLVIAFYSYLSPQIARGRARGGDPAREALAHVIPQHDPVDRLTGVVFGFGCAGLGAFGLSASRDPGRGRPDGS